MMRFPLKISQKPFILALLLLTAGGLGYGYFWKHQAQLLEKNLETWMSEVRQKGYAISFQTLRVTGFPFALEVIGEKPTFSHPQAPIFHVEIEGELRAKAHLMSPTQIQFYSTGKTRLISPFLSSLPLKPLLQIEHFQGSFNPLSQDFSTTLTLEKVSYSQADRLKASVETATFSLRQGHFLEDTLNRKATALILDLTQLHLDVTALDHLHLTAHLMGEFPLENLKLSAQKWYEQGGTLELNDLTLRQKEAFVKASGTLALDENLQPLGAFSLEINKLGSLAQSLFPKTPVSAYLSLIPQGKTPTGELEPLKLSLTLQDQEASLKFMKWPLPKLDWDALQHLLSSFNFKS